MRQGYSFHVESYDGPFDVDVQLTNAEMRKASNRLNILLAQDKIVDWQVTEYPEKGLAAFVEQLENNLR